MTSRQNLCPNPASKNDVTGYAYFSGGSTVVQATSLAGYPRTTGARFSSSGTPMTPNAACSVGQAITMSFYAASESASDLVVDLYFLTNGSNTQGASVSIPFAVAGVVQRVSITRTIPSGQTTCRCLIDNFNASVTPLVITACLTEVAASADTYFDGDTSGATWDGTNGSSTSTFAGGLTQALPVAVDASSAIALGRRKTRALSTVIDLSSAVTLGRRKTRVLPVSLEVSSAVTLGRLKTRTLPVAAETSSGLALGKRKTRVLPPALEADTAVALGGAAVPGGVGPRRVQSTAAGRKTQSRAAAGAVQSTPQGRRTA